VALFISVRCACAYCIVAFDLSFLFLKRSENSARYTRLQKFDLSGSTIFFRIIS